MRIACIHIPQFGLQCATRLDPSLRGAPVVVVSGVEPGRERAGVLHAPIVLACSRAAWAHGVRLGMTATAARGLSPELKIVTADALAERETVRAIADGLLAVAPVVDTGGRVGAGGAHLAMYAEVPAKTRGASFGDRLIELLAELGLSARVGIADDRFTAWVAAAHSGSDEHEVVTVPRGGSAAFLSPRPLSLLAITPEVQHMLEALGVRTLGEFAALPAPSVARPLEADYQGLARGDSGSLLRAYTPESSIREEVVVSAGGVLELAGEVGGTAAIALVARRIALRLAGRGRAAARLEVAAIDAAGVAHDIEVPLDHAIGEAEELARALGPVLDPTASLRQSQLAYATAGGVQPGLPLRPAQAHVLQSMQRGGTAAPWRLRVTVAGEAFVGSDAPVTEVFAEGTSPFARNAAANDQLVAQPSSEPARAALASEYNATLSVVLASTGSLFALSPTDRDDRSERREAHRRTRRGKQRRTRPDTYVQPRLFDRQSVK